MQFTHRESTRPSPSIPRQLLRRWSWGRPGPELATLLRVAGAERGARGDRSKSCALREFTVVPGTTAPFGSVTVPVKVARVVWLRLMARRTRTRAPPWCRPVTNVATNIATTAKTNNEGQLHVHRAHTRRVRASRSSRPASSAFVQSGIVLQIAQATRLDIPLEVGAGDRRGLGRRRGAARPQHLERARPGDRLQADPVAAAQRPALPAARSR